MPLKRSSIRGFTIRLWKNVTLELVTVNHLLNTLSCWRGVRLLWRIEKGCRHESQRNLG